MEGMPRPALQIAKSHASYSVCKSNLKQFDIPPLSTGAMKEWRYPACKGTCYQQRQLFDIGHVDRGHPTYRHTTTMAKAQDSGRGRWAVDRFA
jgi:hypothetical protein